MQSNDEINRLLTQKGMQLMCERLQTESAIPQRGLFRACFICFDYRGSQNEAHFRIEHVERDIRYLRLMAVRPSNGLAVSNYMKKGTNQELIEYLSDEGNVDEFLAVFQHLSASVDDKCD